MILRVEERMQELGDAGHDVWFRAKVHEALVDTRPAAPRSQIMDEVQTLIDRKRRARS